MILNRRLRKNSVKLRLPDHKASSQAAVSTLIEQAIAYRVYYRICWTLP